MATSLFSPDDTQAIETKIHEYFIDAVKRSEAVGPAYTYLWKNLHELIQAGGKRFRPNMTVLAYRLFDGSDIAGVIPIAAAQELLHFSLLIHDDIIDRDYMRYGVPNMSGRYKARYHKYLRDDHEVTHFAHGSAILAGDLMLSGAHELITQSSVDSELRRMAQAMLCKSVFDVAGGELLDSEVSILPYTPGDALRIALYKTARYSFVTPILTGAMLAGAGQKQNETLKHYAEALGVAYQLVDDVLSVFGEEKQTGKSTLGDIREGKRTFMVEEAMNSMDTSDKILFNQAFGNQQATTESIIQVKELLISSGAKAKTERAIDEYKDRAYQAVDTLNLGLSQKEKLTQLITIVTDRVS